MLSLCCVPKQAYVQQLETSRIKLSQLEQDLQRARQQVLNFCTNLYNILAINADFTNFSIYIYIILGCFVGAVLGWLWWCWWQYQLWWVLLIFSLWSSKRANKFTKEKGNKRKRQQLLSTFLYFVKSSCDSQEEMCDVIVVFLISTLTLIRYTNLFQRIKLIYNILFCFSPFGKNAKIYNVLLPRHVLVFNWLISSWIGKKIGGGVSPSETFRI